MDDALLVRGVECIGDLSCDVEGLGKAEGAALRPIEAFGERVAIDQFQDERVDVGRFFRPINGADVGMVQRREQPRFAFEARQACCR